MKNDGPSRRSFLHTAGLGSAGTLVRAAPLQPAAAPAGNVEPIKITRIDAVTFREGIHVGGDPGGSEDAEFFWVRLHADNGLIGTGETYPFTHAEAGALKDYAPRILGRDPRDIDGIWRDLYHEVAMRTAGGADMRVLSAINMAQLDILGQACGLPLYRLLGGRTRPRVRVYNTTTDYWAINGMKMGPDTIKIARFLLDRGITAMKIYPFDHEGDYSISNRGLETGMKWLRDLRERFANEIDICVDCWGRFNLPSAVRIAKALEPYSIMYLEDAMLAGNARSYARLAAETSVPICVSETLATRWGFREYFEEQACGVVMYDLTWCGGPSEAKRISDMAAAYQIPTSPHTCGGPLLYTCSAHLATAVPNFLIMESNYWKYTHQFPYFVKNAPVPSNGHVTPPDLPGIGAGIRPELFQNGDAIVETVATS